MVFRATVFPSALGPLMMVACFSSPMRISMGTAFSPFESRMKGLTAPLISIDPPALYPGPHAIEGGGEKGEAVMEIEVGDDGEGLLHLLRIAAHLPGQVAEYPLFLFLLLLLEDADRVVDLHDLDGLHERGFQRMGVVVDDALKELVVVGLEGYHVPAVPDGDVRILHDRPAPRPSP